MPDRVQVTTTEFIRNIGYWQSEALQHPVAITHHGRERLVLSTPDEFRPALREAPPDANAKGVELRADNYAILNNLDEIFLRVNAALEIRAVNSVAEAFVGRSRIDIIGVSILDVMPQPLGSMLADRVQRVIRTRQIEAFEAGAFDGREVSVRVVPLSGAVAVLLRNTTAEHAQRAKAEETEALLAAARHHPIAMTVRLDARARIESIDQALSSCLRFEANDVVGHRFVDLTAGAQRRQISEMIEEGLRQGTPNCALVTLIGKGGDEIDAVLSLAPIVSDFVVRGMFGLLVVTKEAGRVAA
ncbi:MAG: PAS domain-containing protein [Caulobacterales bacterium]